MPNSAVGSGRKLVRHSALTLLLATLVLAPSGTPRAQRSKNPPVNVAGVSTRQAGGKTVVTVSADSNLNRTQTWQDDEGFHLVLPQAGRSNLKTVPRGVKVRKLDTALELVVPVKPGSNVTVEPHYNHLNLVVNGGIDTTRRETEEFEAPARKSERAERRAEQYTEAPAGRLPRERRNAVLDSAVGSISQNQTERSASTPAQTSPSVAANPTAPNESSSSKTVNATAQSGNPQQANPQPGAQSQASPQAGSQTANSAQAGAPQLIPTTDTGEPAPSDANGAQASQPSQVQVVEQGPGLVSKIFSATGVAVILALGLISLLVVRRWQSARGSKNETEETKNEEKAAADEKGLANLVLAKTAKSEMLAVEQQRENGRKSLGRPEENGASQAKERTMPVPQMESHQQALEVRQPVTAPAAIYGAYRVDQEVGKLLLGQPHRMDVLLSRATDDRRAMETSLLKAMQSPDVDEDGRRRARRALEEYGFVARQSAALLLAHDAYQRSSAARVLGEIGAASSLPFLLEALYDSEMVVRTQAVASLGELKLPAAIGALLDVARRHADIPSELISRALTACSVDCLGDLISFNLDAELPALPGSNSDEEEFTGEITHLDPSGTVEQLPEWLENESLSDALTRLESADVEARTAAVRQLAQFQVQRAVEALAAIASRDEDASVRAAAVASLGAIDHESVFAPVLIGIADEAREVRAAAARSLSRLSFDRADAYVRVLETADAETLSEVARACIKAGITQQAIDRLASEDRRQAYEAFSMLSILAKSNEVEPMLEAIGNHADINVRLAATRLLGLSGRPEVSEQLRHLIVRDGLPERVRTALLEVVYKMDQTQPV